MKKLLFFILFSLPFFLFAQSLGSLNIFSENGDKFYLLLDGVKQNDSAFSNVRIQDLPDLYYSVKIVFAENSLAAVSKNNLYISDGNDILCDAAYRLRREKGGKSRLTFYSLIHAQQNFYPTAGMHMFHFGQPAVSETMIAAEPKNNNPSENDSSRAFGSLTVFSINADKFYLYLDGIKQNEAAQSNIRVRGLSEHHYNIKLVFKDAKILPIIKNNVFISDDDDNIMDASYRLRRDPIKRPRLNFYSLKPVQPDFTASAGMFVYNFNTPAQPVSGGVVVKMITPKTENSREVFKTTLNPGAVSKKIPPTQAVKNAEERSPENKKCSGWPMNTSDLTSAKKAIGLAKEDEDKLAVASDIIASNCLTASQVTEFCNLFKTEKSKLAFAKYAYRFTLDRKNYAIVNTAFNQEASKKELDKFINGG